MPQKFEPDFAPEHSPAAAPRTSPEFRRGVAEGAADPPAAAELAALLALRPPSPLRSVPDRVTFSWPAASPRWIVKRTRGDLGREAWYDRLHGARGRSPGRREFENLWGLAAAGLRVPEAVAWAEAGDVSLVVMARVAHERDLRAVLAAEGAAAARRWLGPLVEFVARLHGAGWYHRDLYLQHFLPVTGPGAPELCLIDVGRARRQERPRRRWFLKDLGALLHSTPDAVPRSFPLRFLSAYLDARGVTDRAARRRWARAAERRRARIARHAPRFGEGPPVA